MTLSTVDWFQVLEIMDAKLALEQGAVALSTTQVYSLNPNQPTWNKCLEHKTSVFWLVFLVNSNLQADNYRRELEICCNDLSTCLDVNAKKTK
jgi:hypothetical protein